MSFEVEWTTTTTEEHVERGAEIDAKGGGRSEVRFANFSFFSNCPRLPSAYGNGDGVDVDEKVEARRLRLDGGEAILDGGHSGDAREVDERRSGPHQRERERATQGELVSVTRKEGNIDNTSRD